MNQATGPAQLPFDRGVLDLARRAWVTPSGDAVELTPLESELVRYLAERVGVIVARSELLERVWGYAPGVKSRAVDNTVRRLRQKLDDPREPESLIQSVYGGGYRFDAVPLRGHAGPITPLPPAAERQALIGRATDLDRLAHTVDSHRWVTLYGPGGVGKTSLARAILRQRGGSWVDLTQAHTTAELVAAVSLGLQIPPGRDLEQSLERVGIALEARPGLMVFDNCEQLDDPAVAAIAVWAASAPELVLLTTSRRPLAGMGEHRLSLEPLADEDALALLVRSARVVAADFDPAPDRERWLDVVRLLDGLPLAVVLCAPRVGTLSPDALIDRLQQSLVLARRHPDGKVPDRHLALSRSLLWSWSLLPDADRHALIALARIPGPFGLEQAEAVIGNPQALDHIDDLLGSCWLHRTPVGELALYQSMATFIDEQATPELADPAEDRRRRWLLDQLEHATHDWLLTHAHALERAIWRGLSRAPAEAAALAHALDRVSAGLGLERLSAVLAACRDRLEPSHPMALTLELDLVGLESERQGASEALRARVEAVLAAAPDAVPAIRTRGLRQLGRLARYQGDLDEADALLATAAEVASASGERLLRAAIANDRGLMAFHRNDHASAHHYHLDALALYRELDHPIGEGQSLANLGKVLRHLGRHDEGERMIRSSLELLDERATFQRAITLTNLGNLELSRGRPEHALDSLEQALELFRKAGALRHTGMVGASVALAELMGEHFAEAEARALTAARQLERAGELRTQGRVWTTVVAAAIAQGDLSRATEGLERSRACFEACQFGPGLVGLRGLQCVVDALRGLPWSEPDLDPDQPCRLLAHALTTPDPALTLRQSGKRPLIEADATFAAILLRVLVEG